VGRIEAANRAEFIAALRKRLAELEHDVYINDAMMSANPKNVTAGDVEVARWRRLEAEAIRAAIAELDIDLARIIPLWLYLALSIMVVVALVLAGVALWMQ
jgi:hypothetical protein